jgi:hypothetical protein
LAVDSNRAAIAASRVSLIGLIWLAGLPSSQKRPIPVKNSGFAVVTARNINTKSLIILKALLERVNLDDSENT